VYEAHGANELVELFFCATSPDVPPTWPRVLDEAEREALPGLSCVHFLDPHKAPWQWKAQLVLPAASTSRAGVEVSRELSTDGETPGFLVVAGARKQVCYASGVREDSRLQRSWFHPTGRFVAALIDGRFHHCPVLWTGKPDVQKPPLPGSRRRRLP
jgi:hypothetical protein